MKTILFLIGTMVLNCRDVYAYTWIRWPRPLTPEHIILRDVLVVIGVVLVLMAIKAKKDGDEDLKEGKNSDESVKKFLRDEQEKSKK